MSTVTPITDYESFLVSNKQGETMIITINERTGHFTASGDYGDFSHYWCSRGPLTLREFISGIQYDYAMGKLSNHTHGERFSFNKSVDNLFRKIRKQREVSRAIRSEAINFIRELEYTDSAEMYCQQIYSSEEIQAVFEDGLYEAVSLEHEPDPHCVAFWNDFFIPFVESYNPKHTMKRVAVSR